ncbi:MAG: RNA polymerase sigma-70 factor [Bacteroidetes bacterium]|nr:RNA polymerase sigma-70 factor [Bacteroidota bacterium]
MQEQFEIIYRTYYNTLRNVVENIINDKDASHDVVQEVFLKLWRKRDELDLILDKRSYLFRSSINASITYLEHNKHCVQLTDVIAGTENADSTILTKELELKVQIALDKLPPKCKAIFILSRFENMKYKEIAAFLDVSEKTIENQIGIALKRMRDDLKRYLTKGFSSFHQTK